MSHKEKEYAVSLFSSVVVSVPYILLALNYINSLSLDTTGQLKYWAAAVLLIIPIRILIHIIVYIILSIVSTVVTGESTLDEVTDERDKTIELKGDRVTSNALVFGLMAAMAALVLEAPVSVMFIIILGSGFFGEILSYLVKFYYYAKGV